MVFGVSDDGNTWKAVPIHEIYNVSILTSTWYYLLSRNSHYDMCCNTLIASATEKCKIAKIQKSKENWKR